MNTVKEYKMQDSNEIKNSFYSANSLLDDENEPSLKLVANSDSTQRLAITLMNWSTIPENDQHMLHEGAIQALVSLASIDNDDIKKCVASAFYHLSSRETNRLEMLRLGAVNGLVAIAMHSSKFQIAKLCALTLCNLSMAQNEESALAENGTILALVILLGLRGHRLLPICVQALYNLTSCGWTQHFKPETMRKIVKALTNVPHTFFDHHIYLVKAILNISRFSWVRSRMVEDGTLHSLITFTESIPNRTERELNSHYAVSCIRMFSENKSGRTELMNKNIFIPLKTIQRYCDRDTTLQLVLTVFNLMQQLPMPSLSIDIAVHMITYILYESNVVNENDIQIYQYCSACLYLFCQQNQKFSASTLKKLLKSVMKLLGHENEFIQACIIFSCETLFFNKHMRSLVEETREFISKFTTTASLVTDKDATVILATTIAKLAHETFYMTILSESGLLNPLLKLLLDLDKKLKKNYSVKESVCVSITHIALNMKTLPGFVDIAMADILTDLLNEDDPDLVRNAICSIRSLSQINLSQEELISEEVTIRIATVIETYPNDAILIRNSLAVLAVFSYNPDAHDALSVPDVIQLLYKLTSSEDITCRELVATTLCNLSITPKSRKSLMKSKVIGVLEYLSGTTSELIQELIAKCICNLTYQPIFHQQMINEGVLNIIMMISLVRSISTVTKQLCARAFLNLLRNENLKDINDAGAVRIFANLSSIDCTGLQNICARGFLIFTGTEDKREILLKRPLFLQALFSMVNCISEQAKMMIGVAICNLLCCPTAQSFAISCGGISVLKVLSVTDTEDMKEFIARVIISLVSQPNLKNVLLEESLVSVLVLFLQQDSRRLFDIAIHAVSCMAQMSEYRTHMIDEGIVDALVSAVISGKWDSAIFALRVSQIFCLLSFSYERAESMVFDSQIGVAFHILYLHEICTPKTACLIAICLRNLSFDSKSRVQLIKQNCLRLLAAMLTDVFTNAKNEFTFVRQCVLPFLHNICLEKSLHDEIIKQGLMKLLYILTFRRNNNDDDTSDSDNESNDEDSIDEFELEKRLKHNTSKNQQMETPLAVMKLKECKARKSFMMRTNSNSKLDSLNSNTINNVSNSSNKHEDNIDHNTTTSNNNKHVLNSNSENVNSIENDTMTTNINTSRKIEEEEDYYSLPNQKSNTKRSMELMACDIHHITYSINLVCDTESCHTSLIDYKCIEIFSYLSDNRYIIDLSRHQIASAICKLASTTNIKDKQILSHQGATEILKSIANTVVRTDTQQQCSLALGYLSDITKVNTGVVQSLLLLSKNEQFDALKRTANNKTEFETKSDNNEFEYIKPENDHNNRSNSISTKNYSETKDSNCSTSTKNSVLHKSVSINYLIDTDVPSDTLDNNGKITTIRDNNNNNDDGMAIGLLKKRYSKMNRISCYKKKDQLDSLQDSLYLSNGLKKLDRNNLLIAGILINSNSTSEDIENAILPKDGFKIKTDEIDMCYVDYSLYLFEVYESTVKSEMAGPAKKIKFPNLSLPKATVRQGNDLSNRYNQLPSVPQITEPLPKDLTPVSLTMDFKDQRDDIQTKEIGDTMLDHLPNISKINVRSKGMGGGILGNKNGNCIKSKTKRSKQSSNISKIQFNRKSNGDSHVHIVTHTHKSSFRSSIYSQSRKLSDGSNLDNEESSETESVSDTSSRLSSRQSSSSTPFIRKESFASTMSPSERSIVD